MALKINYNASAKFSLGEMNREESLVGKLLSQVSGGEKISTVKDDASAYAISERMRVKLRALRQDEQNIQNAASLLKIAEGGWMPLLTTFDICKRWQLMPPPTQTRTTTAQLFRKKLFSGLTKLMTLRRIQISTANICSTAITASEQFTTRRPSQLRAS